MAVVLIKSLIVATLVSSVGPTIPVLGEVAPGDDGGLDPGLSSPVDEGAGEAGNATGGGQDDGGQDGGGEETPGGSGSSGPTLEDPRLVELCLGRSCIAL